MDAARRNLYCSGAARGVPLSLPGSFHMCNDGRAGTSFGSLRHEQLTSHNVPSYHRIHRMIFPACSSALCMALFLPNQFVDRRTIHISSGSVRSCYHALPPPTLTHPGFAHLRWTVTACTMAALRTLPYLTPSLPPRIYRGWVVYDPCRPRDTLHCTYHTTTTPAPPPHHRRLTAARTHCANSITAPHPLVAHLARWKKTRFCRAVSTDLPTPLERLHTFVAFADFGGYDLIFHDYVPTFI